MKTLIILVLMLISSQIVSAQIDTTARNKMDSAGYQLYKAGENYNYAILLEFVSIGIATATISDEIDPDDKQILYIVSGITGVMSIVERILGNIQVRKAGKKLLKKEPVRYWDVVY